MPETITLLEQATSAEATKFQELVAALKHDELYMFIHAVAELKPERGEDAALDAVRDIIHIARNVKHIDAALDNFYVS
jgi:hypothetical protein